MSDPEKENSMSSTETLHSTEKVEQVQNPESHDELENLFSNYKKEKLDSVDQQSQSALNVGETKLAGASSFGYSLEQLKQIRQEQGVDSRLAENAQQIEQLRTGTRARIESLVSNEAIENKAEKEKTFEQFEEQREGILASFLTSEMANNGLDLIPFAGSGKMIVESIAGKTLTGKNLTGKARIIHAAIGAGSLALDFTGIGEAKDAVLIAGKSIGLVEKVGTKLAEHGALKSAKVFEITSKFMAEHPQLVTHVEKYAEAKLRAGIQSIKDYRKQAA